jgi:hypothetical protein
MKKNVFKNISQNDTKKSEITFFVSLMNVVCIYTDEK